jgi:alcohol dehydrogenase
MPDTVEAVVLTEARTFETRTFPRPPVGPDDGLLRVELAGICHTDVDIVTGGYPTPLPLIMGHEIVGRIEQVGARAARRWGVAAGDRVVVEPMVACGACPYCTAGDSRFCDNADGYGTVTSSDVAPHLWGAYSPLMHLAPGSVVHRVPDGTSAEVGMLCTVAIANAVQWTLARGGVGQGHDVVVQGVGPIGLCCVAAARAAGARTVIATGLPRDVLGRELAPEFGADVVVTAGEQDVVAAVRDATGGRLADVVVDTTGSPQALRTSLDLVRKTGTVVSGGVTGKDVLTPLPMDVVTLKEIRLQGVFSFDSSSVRRAMTLAATGRFPFEKLVTHRFDLHDAEAAIAAVSNHDLTDRLKVVLVP